MAGLYGHLFVGMMLIQTVAVSAQIACYVGPKCSGPSVEAENPEQCCLGQGITFTTESLTCEECVVYGWIDGPTFEGSEQAGAYSVEVGYLKGEKEPSHEVLAVQDIPETARKGFAYDYTIHSYEAKTDTRRTKVYFTLVIDGVAMEPNETFLMRLVPRAGIGTILKDNEFLVDTIQIIIVDSDVVHIQLSESDYRSREYHGHISIVVVKNGLLATPVTVRVNPVNYTQLVASGYPFPLGFPRVPKYDPKRPNIANSYPEERQDFDITPIVVTFDNDDFHQSEVNTPVTIYDDSRNEATEFFVVTLEVISALNPDKVIIQRHASLCRIADDDPIKLGFEQPSYTFPEKEDLYGINVVKDDQQISEQELEYLVEVTQPPSGKYTVATHGLDFAIGPTAIATQRFTFLASEETNEFFFSIRGDYEPERTEVFALHVARSLGEVIFLDGRFPTTLVFIIDDDPAIQVGFERNITAVREEDGSVEVCIRVFNLPENALLPFPFSLDLFTLPNTAGLSDYTAINSANNPLEEFSDSLTRQCFSVGIIDDFLFEQTEAFVLQLGKEPGEDRLQVTHSTTTVRILDNDFVRIGFEKTEYIVDESEGTVSVQISILEGQLERNVSVELSTESGTAKDTEDFTRIIPMILVFNNSTTSVTVEIPITDDSIPEGIESFDVKLRPFSPFPTSAMIVSPRVAVVLIRDDDEAPSAPKNDTGIGDPLFAAPLNIRNFETSDIGTEQPVYLCYEVHGASNAYFNLVSDECVSVNAHYHAVNRDVNIMDKIAIRAVDNTSQSCSDILVSLDQCSLSVDGENVDRRFSQNGIRVTRREALNRVQISLPNCADHSLVVWVVCEKGDAWDPLEQRFVKTDMLRFVIQRGLNLQEWSHGLVGQFWNIPITAEHFDGVLSNGAQAQNIYAITVQHPHSRPRSFLGMLYPLTWDRSHDPCLYAGNGQGGRSGIARKPDDTVIEGRYFHYRTKGAFETEFRYSQFDSTKCQVDG